MEIVQFDEKFADEMAELYARVYSEGEGKNWSVEKAKQSIETCYKYFSQYCFMAVEEGLCLGGIFCLVNPYYNGDILYIISIQVQPEAQGKGIGQALLKRAIKASKDSGLTGIRFLTDERKEFPKRWYEKLGFRRSGFVEYEGKLDDLKV